MRTTHTIDNGLHREAVFARPSAANRLSQRALVISSLLLCPERDSREKGSR